MRRSDISSGEGLRGTNKSSLRVTNKGSYHSPNRLIGSIERLSKRGSGQLNTLR